MQETDKVVIPRYQEVLLSTGNFEKKKTLGEKSYFSLVS